MQYHKVRKTPTVWEPDSIYIIQPTPNAGVDFIIKTTNRKYNENTSIY